MCCPIYTFILWFSWLFVIYELTREGAKGSAADRTALIRTVHIFSFRNTKYANDWFHEGKSLARPNGPSKFKWLDDDIWLATNIEFRLTLLGLRHFLSISASTYSDTWKSFFFLRVSVSFSSCICRCMRILSLHTFTTRSHFQCLAPNGRVRRWGETQVEMNGGEKKTT